MLGCLIEGNKSPFRIKVSRQSRLAALSGSQETNDRRITQHLSNCPLKVSLQVAFRTRLTVLFSTHCILECRLFAKCQFDYLQSVYMPNRKILQPV